MTGRMQRIRHPGKIAVSRVMAIPCEAVPLRVTLAAGQSLTAAVHHALARLGFDFGYLRLDGASFAPLRFVTPAPSPDDQHAAWYSVTHDRAAPSRVRHAGVHLGLREGQPFLHCHGIWETPKDRPDAGHMLCDQSILSQDVAVTGWGLKGAGLVARHDPETNFMLFQPQALAVTGKANAWLVTLRPNQDIGAALREVLHDAGLAAARIEGIGSLVGSRFSDGRVIESLATEIMILDGQILQQEADLRIVSVGFDGQGHVGHLEPGRNAVCVTAEILVLPEVL